MTIDGTNEGTFDLYAPSPASSGKVTRHRLNRGGDRAANSALHIIAIGRLRTDPRSKTYVARRIAEVGDLWQDMPEQGHSLRVAAERLSR